ncbi:MAG TPA: hypothetical protein VEB86_19910, partial [Chryseosolibacter sp.]|nr:hypothetical protein [Chryseosolibacter sp.]
SLVLIVPLISFLSWLLFIRSGYTYAENFVLGSFLFGLANIFRIFIFIPLHVMMPAKTTLIDLGFQILFLFYFIVGFRQFFKNHMVWTVIKSVVLFVLFIVLYWVLMIAYAYTKIGILDLMG